MNQREFYIDAVSGSDTSPGSKTEPWRSLAKASEIKLQSGDQIFLRGDQSHPGSLLLSQSIFLQNRPVTIKSYGGGRAKIIAGDDGGILIWNSGGFALSGLEIIGSGYPRNNSHGLCIFTDGNSAKPEEVTAEDIEISGFGCSGVSIGSKGRNGFRNVTLRRIHAHHNAYAGIFVWGPGVEACHELITIQDCNVENNDGIPGLIQASGHGIHSGHGILLSCVDHGLIEGCKASGNGSLNTAHHSGPAGIWSSNSRHIVIRRNESFRNRTASSTDGGGFGLDGGVTDSIMEDNFSHDNDGPGFLFAQYYGAKSFFGNKMINNVSENDARANDNGALHVWGPSDESIENLLIQGNQVRLTSPGRGRARVLWVDAKTKNLRILDNQFSGISIQTLLQVHPLQTDLIYKRNTLDFESGSVLWKGRFFASSQEWTESLPKTFEAQALGEVNRPLAKYRFENQRTNRLIYAE